ncbi:MAG: hypothetical protein WAV07_15485 [Candidatus Contendobacter sp.]
MNMRILVVDDDPSLPRIIAATLGRWNYDAIEINHTLSDAYATIRHDLESAAAGLPA